MILHPTQAPAERDGEAERITGRTKLEPSMAAYPKSILRVYPGQKDPRERKRRKADNQVIEYKTKYYG